MSRPVQTLRIKMMSGGDSEYVSRLQKLLRQQEANGDIRIVFMDDEIAKIENLNPAWARLLSDDDGAAS